MNLLTCACCGCHVIDETTDWVCAIVPALPEKEEEKEDEETLVECALTEFAPARPPGLDQVDRGLDVLLGGRPSWKGRFELCGRAVRR